MEPEDRRDHNGKEQERTEGERVEAARRAREKTEDIRATLDRLREELRDVEKISGKERLLRFQVGEIKASTRLGQDFERRLEAFTRNVIDNLEEDLRFSLEDLSHELGVAQAGWKPDRIRGGWVPPDKLAVFCQKTPLLLSALGDRSRLKILKTLEMEGPLYPTELSEITRIRAGSFSHHMKVLKDEDAQLGVSLITQEAKRGRYLIGVFGREALKFAEVLFVRQEKQGGPRKPVPVEVE